MGGATREGTCPMAMVSGNASSPELTSRRSGDRRRFRSYRFRLCATAIRNAARDMDAAISEAKALGVLGEVSHEGLGSGDFKGLLRKVF
jgi:hypothetical protein